MLLTYSFEEHSPLNLQNMILFVHPGGAENIVSTTGSRHLHGLNGCIKNFKLGNRNINLIDNASGGHHVEQCF